MTRKCLTLFLILLVCAYFLLSGLLGEDGLLCRKRLEGTLESENDLLKRLDLEKNELERQKEAIYTKEHLMEAARTFGYGAEGEKVSIPPRKAARAAAPASAAASGPGAAPRPSGRLGQAAPSCPPLSRRTIFAISLLVSAAGALVCRSGSAGAKQQKKGARHDSRKRRS